MKKAFLFLYFFTSIFTCSLLFSQSLPPALEGLWEGKDRYVFLENNEEGLEIVIVLKEYYGWYYDRAAETLLQSEQEPRINNAATHKEAEHVKIKKIISLINPGEKEGYEKPEDCAWELKLNFSKFQQNLIPLCVIDDKIYLNFFVKNPEWDKAGRLIINQEGLWRGNAASRGLTLDSQIQSENIGLLIFDGQKIFNIRYWLTDMDYFDASVSFKFDNKEYTLPKLLSSCGHNYSCVSSYRSKKIRNILAPTDFKEEEWVFNKEKTLVAVNEPYLQLLADKKTFADLIEIVKAANSRRKPDPAPLFPEKELDWHWDLIDYLEKDNELIKKVRERQREFGPRGKDFNK